MATVSRLALRPRVEAFLNKERHGGWVNGKEVMSRSGATVTTIDPGTGQELARVADFSAEEVDAAVASATAAFRSGAWSTLPVNERCAKLHRLADAVEKHAADIAQIESLDAGKIYSQALGDVENFIETIRYYADLAQHVQPRTVLAIKGHDAWTMRHPWGPCGFIIPWNFPFLLLGWGIAPALAAGNTVVVKPAEDTPLSTLFLTQLAQEAGIPDGVINVVPGRGETAGAALSGNPSLKRMSFTGSPEVGRLVAEACGRNLVPVKCELGGKGAAVIFDDVDVELTAQQLVEAITFHTGQVCCDATRWLIQDSIYDRFVDECVDRLSSVRIGYQCETESQMGPVVSEKQRRRVLGYLDKGVQGGAKLLLEGGAAKVDGCEGGFFVKPALLAGSADNVAAREEIFGPVAYLGRFSSESEAIAMANDTSYGLANSVWSSDLARAQRVAEAFDCGNGWINAHNVFAHGIPYAGIKNSGMGGGVLSPETLLDYWRSISVVRPLS